MTDQHPITPPPELVQQWCYEDGDAIRTSPRWYQILCAKVARWGADRELEACCKTLDDIWDDEDVVTIDDFLRRLRAIRRPKPPSLNSIALQMLGTIERDAHYLPEITDTIRRALEQRDD